MSTQLVGALLVTHGQVGQELLAAAEMIVGEFSHIASISIGWQVDVNESKKDIETAIRNINQGKGVIILTDSFGGTPSNIALSLLKKGEIEIVTGVNLPMVIKLANQTGEEDVCQLASAIKEQGQKQISIASELLGE
jgi:PTS system mannose-specific IIA component